MTERCGAETTVPAWRERVCSQCGGRDIDMCRAGLSLYSGSIRVGESLKALTSPSTLVSISRSAGRPRSRDI